MLKMGNDWCHSWLPLEAYTLVVGPPRLSVGQKEDEVVLPHHSTPIIQGRMATRLYCCCRLPLSPKPEELWWHSCMLLLRGMMLSLEALGPRLSIGINIVVTPFIDVLVA